MCRGTECLLNPPLYVCVCVCKFAIPTWHETQPMQESEEKVICMAGVDEAALEELVRFAYCGRVTLTEETVLEVLVAANRLQMPQVVEQACDFLLLRMDSSNCLVRPYVASDVCVRPLPSLPRTL